MLSMPAGEVVNPPHSLKLLTEECALDEVKDWLYKLLILIVSSSLGLCYIFINIDYLQLSINFS